MSIVCCTRLTFLVEFKKEIYHEDLLLGFGSYKRQVDALLYFKSQGEILNADYMTEFDIFERTARYDLVEMVEKGLLSKTGDRKSTKYVFR